jgi:hypothetical protein
VLVSVGKQLKQNQMKKKILQSIANWILRQMDKTNKLDVIQFYYDMGTTLDDIAYYTFDVILD